MAELINESLVRLDADLGAEKTDVINAMAGIVGDAGRATDVEQLAADALARERRRPPASTVASPSPTAAARVSRCRRWPSSGCRRASTSAPRTGPRTWRS